MDKNFPWIDRCRLFQRSQNFSSIWFGPVTVREPGKQTRWQLWKSSSSALSVLVHSWASSISWSPTTQLALPNTLLCLFSVALARCRNPNWSQNPGHKIKGFGFWLLPCLCHLHKILLTFLQHRQLKWNLGEEVKAWLRQQRVYEIVLWSTLPKRIFRCRATHIFLF